MERENRELIRGELKDGERNQRRLEENRKRERGNREDLRRTERGREETEKI